MARPTIYTQEMIEKYTRAGYWTSVTLPDLWEKNAREYPGNEAIVDSRFRLTWSQASSWIDRLAMGLLGLGLNRDDVLVTQLPNSVEKTLLRVAAQKAGLLHLWVLSTLRHTEIESILNYTEARALVIPWKFRNFDHWNMVQELKPRLPKLKCVLVAGEDIPAGALSLKELLNKRLETTISPDYFEGKKFSSLEVSQILLTTGTTGTPKLVEVPICCKMMGTPVTQLKLTSRDTAVAFSPAPEGPNIPVYYGVPVVAAKAVMLEHWSLEEALALIEKEKISIMCVVPTMLAQMNSYANLKNFNLSSVRAIWCSGAPLPHDLALNIEDKLEIPIMNVYGAQDFGGISGSSVDEPQEVRLLTEGLPHPGNEIKLVDSSGKEAPRGEIGEILVRGPYGSSGYYKDPEMTAKAWDKEGWYRTGDLGKMDGGGHLIIVGREKNIIIRGGQNIFPGEIENLLLSHPKVANTAIAGIPHAVMGEIACACVIPRLGSSLSFEEMTTFLKSRNIAAYKLPEKLLIMESFPYLEGLKLDIRTLRARAIELIEQGLH